MKQYIVDLIVQHQTSSHLPTHLPTYPHLNTYPHLPTYPHLHTGIQHSVAGADYGTVRAATFMGRHIIMETNNQCTSAQHCDTSAQHSDTQTNAKAAEAMQNDTTAAIQQNDATAALQATQNSNTAAAAAAQQLYIDHTTTQTIEYLACMSVSDFRTNHMSTLPHTATGAVYVQQHGPTHGDAVTRIIPDRQYSIRDAAAHPVEECFRARVFRQVCVLVVCMYVCASVLWCLC